MNRRGAVEYKMATAISVQGESLELSRAVLRPSSAREEGKHLHAKRSRPIRFIALLCGHAGGALLPDSKESSVDLL